MDDAIRRTGCTMGLIHKDKNRKQAERGVSIRKKVEVDVLLS